MEELVDFLAFTNKGQIHNCCCHGPMSILILSVLKNSKKKFIK